MNRVLLCTAAALFGCLFLLCSKYPEPRTCKDALGIGKPLSEILKGKFGLFVAKKSAVSSTVEFSQKKLLLFGNTEGHMDRIAFLGMQKTNHFLFRGVVVIDSIDDPEIKCPSKDTPCMENADTLENSILDKLPRQRKTYGPATDLYKLFKQIQDSSDYVFVMLKSDARHFSKALNEVVVQ